MKKFLETQAFILLLNKYLKEAETLTAKLANVYPAEEDSCDVRFSFAELRNAMQCITLLYEMINTERNLGENNE